MKDAVLKLALKFINTIKVEFYRISIAVGVLNHCNPFSDFSPDAELFIQLALQRRPQLFFRFHLAAGKFPLQRHGLALRPLADQDLAVLNDYASYYPLDIGLRHRQ